MNKIKHTFILFFVCSLTSVILGCGGDNVEKLPCFDSSCEEDSYSSSSSSLNGFV